MAQHGSMVVFEKASTQPLPTMPPRTIDNPLIQHDLSPRHFDALHYIFDAVSHKPFCLSPALLHARVRTLYGDKTVDILIKLSIVSLCATGEFDELPL